MQRILTPLRSTFQPMKTIKSSLLFQAQRSASSTNFNDPDARKPTLEIDPFKKSERLKRPISPHLTIYQPQITWYLSAFHRITGVAIGGLFYLTTWGFAALPVDSTSMVSAVHAYPAFALFLGKVLIGAPFFFHSFNGLRHLLWDTASGLTIKSVYSTGYAVLGATGVATVLFALLY